MHAKNNKTLKCVFNNLEQNSKNYLFKPLIASSLALALSAGSVHADQEVSKPGCVGGDGTCTDINGDLTFKFGTGSTTQISEDFRTVTMSNSTSNVDLKDTSFNGDAFNFPNSTMTIDFNGQSSKTFNLTAEAAEFKGNLKISGSGNSNQFTGVFKHGMTGSINIGSDTQVSSANTSFTFGDGAQNAQNTETVKKLEGKITIQGAQNATNNITFKENFTTQGIWTIQGNSEVIFEKNATMESNDEVIYTGWYADKSAAKASFIFRGTNNSIKNTSNPQHGIAIQANANFNGKTAENHLLFEGENSINTIEGNIIATVNLNNGTRKGSNEIVFNQQTATNTIAGNILTQGNSSSENKITFQGKTSNTITGNIDTSVGTAMISFGTLERDGIATTPSNTITGEVKANTSTNKISFNTSGNNKITGKIRAWGGGTALNEIIFRGTGTNEIEGEISAEWQNSLSKNTNIITFENHSGDNKISGNLTNNAQTNIITTSANSQNSSNTTIKGNIQALGGGIATNTITLQSQGTNRIIGDITTGGNSNSHNSNNIYISGKASNTNLWSLDTNTLSFFAGNITTDSGINNNTNIVFEDSIWLPANYKELVSNNSGRLEENSETIPSIETGTLKNNYGTTNIVLRTSSPTLTQGTSMFNVINAGNNGKTNIVVQGQVNIGANVTYGGRFDENNNYIWDGTSHLGEVTFIFANNNNSGATPLGTNPIQDNFSNNSTDVSGTSSKVLGVIYQDGVKLKLKDKVVKIGGHNTSFIQAYKDYFSNIADNGLLTLTTDRKNTSSRSTNTQTDTITIKGLALGDISELGSSNVGDV
ncbi:hypothetical protein, partial [Helicobacter kayseriensis]|uniref:hypothetical protein n=1 Tax=Helicobacter kayseriensis TaxID=2905877 RepID=UPI001E2E4FBA